MLYKSIIRVAGIAAMFAVMFVGGAFAQKVGDVVQITGSSETWRVESAGGDRITLVKAEQHRQNRNRLDGVWRIGSTLHTIRGTTGVWTDTEEAWLRNLTKTGDLTWTADVVTRNRGSGAWNNCTITLSADGQTMRMSGDRNNWTFTRQ